MYLLPAYMLKEVRKCVKLMLHSQKQVYEADTKVCANYVVFSFKAT